MVQDLSQAYDSEGARRGRLTARPIQTPLEAGPTGLHSLHLSGERDGLYYVPGSYQASQPAPLVVMLHGAGGDARSSIVLLQALAEATGVILLVPESRRMTWDVLLSGYGPDVAFINRALVEIFSRYVVDTEHLALAGFSDGASYALSLGLTNGDPFTHILAFSPGFMAPARRHGSPHIYISHGTQDAVLPIQQCSRRIVPQLKREGYDVQYHEFDGPHTVPSEIALEALQWFLQKPDE